MATTFPRLVSASESTGHRRRKTERVTAQAEAWLASMQGDGMTVWLGDASTHGCSVRCAAPWLRTGRFVTITLGEEAAVQAIVRWTRDGVAGMEFLRPIEPSMREWNRLIEQPFA
ncbi:MAG TPA: PilZ domain-containing protein [Novosphingobium sp.]|mgnify:CR=1 FL=1|nr:PilZ domain-containing protein [Novosphingobium sp.]